MGRVLVGEAGQQPGAQPQPSPWLLRLELSWPREYSHGWITAGAGLHGVGIFYAWWYGMGAQAALAGWVTGALYGAVLRTRAERRFDWPAYGPALLLAVLLATLLRGHSWVPTETRKSLPLAYLETKIGLAPFFRPVGLLHYPALLAAGVWWPFVKDRRSLHVGNDQLLCLLLGLSVVYGANTFVALGAWYGGLVKAVRERLLPPTPAGTAAPAVGAIEGILQQQPPPSMALAAGVMSYGAAGSPVRRSFLSPQQPQALAGPGPAGGFAPAPATAEAQFAAAAAAMRYQQQQAAMEASHPRRWLEEPEPAPYDKYGARGLPSRQRSGGWEGVGSPPAAAWRGGQVPVEAPAIVEGPRYSLRSRGQRRGPAPPPQPTEEDRGDMMDLSESPPPGPANALQSPGFYDGSSRRRLSDGLGRYETLSPARY